MRSALVGTNPAFEHVLRGQMIHRKWILHLLAKYGGPTKIRRIGKTRLKAFARSHKARNSEPVIDAMLAAIHGQTVSIAGAEYAELGVAMSAKDALAKLEHRKQIEAQVLKLIQDIPQTEILLSMPGIGPRSAAQILMTVGDMYDFPDAAHLASYAGLSPRTNQSGTSTMEPVKLFVCGNLSRIKYWARRERETCDPIRHERLRHPKTSRQALVTYMPGTRSQAHQ